MKVGKTKERAARLNAKCEQLLQTGERLPRVEIRQLAGLASWMAGLMPQLNAFTRMLWAAVHSGAQPTLLHRQAKTKCMLRTILLWLALGLKLSWEKRATWHKRKISRC